MKCWRNLLVRCNYVQRMRNYTAASRPTYVKFKVRQTCELNNSYSVISKEKNYLSHPFFFCKRNNSYGSEVASKTEDMRIKIDNLLKSKQSSTVLAENKAKEMMFSYLSLNKDDRESFIQFLACDYGTNIDDVLLCCNQISSSKNRGSVASVGSLARLNQSLIPPYQILFSLISRVVGGVKFLVDLREDLLSLLQSRKESNITSQDDMSYINAMNACLKDLLLSWFSVGFLNVERITWKSSCDMLQKISEYEAVHPIRNWADVKHRVGPYRRCFVFTHNSMPDEPIVVLHTALTSEISSSIQDIVRIPHRTDEKEVENTEDIKSAVFYSITSTQKGLVGVELGNYLIKTVVKKLITEFPNITQFSTLSPIPGFKDWLMGEINQSINALKLGNSAKPFLNEEYLSEFHDHFLTNSQVSTLEKIKELLYLNRWSQDPKTVDLCKNFFLRLCAHYLYTEKRRSYALNGVANFHLRNGAVMWRLNWFADNSAKGLNASCGLMVNYRYFLDLTDHHSQKYMEEKFIHTTSQFKSLLEIKS